MLSEAGKVNHHGFTPHNTRRIRELGFQFVPNGGLVGGNFDGCWRRWGGPLKVINTGETAEEPFWEVVGHGRPRTSIFFASEDALILFLREALLGIFVQGAS